MLKLNDLRDYLLNRVDALKRNPEQLLTYIEDGKIIFYNGSNYSHQYRAPAHIVVTDWRGTADDIVLPLLEWLNTREPGRDPENAIKFDIEILDKETIDIALTVELSERVVVTFNKEANTRTVTHVLPPKPIEMNDGASWSIEATSNNGDSVIAPEPE